MRTLAYEKEKQAGQWIKEFVDSAIDGYQNIKETPVFREPSPGSLEKLETMEIPAEGRPAREVLDEMVHDVYAPGTSVQHPRCFSCIPSPVSVYSWMGDILTNAYDRHAGCWMNAQGAALVERRLIQWMCGLAGYPKTAGGLFVSGGSMANLTALTAARDRCLTKENRARAVAYVSSQTHSSVAKGLRIIGFYPEQIRAIPTDRLFRMDVLALQKTIEEDLKNGLLPFAVIATAGTTNTGSIDPFHEISRICREYHMWMHVDGAFGASLLLSEKGRSRLSGIELSDSISWDAHKWLRQTYGCSMVLVRDVSALTAAFSAHPEYLKDADDGSVGDNFWDLGPELTRPARALKLWLTLQMTGTKSMEEMIDHGCEMAEFTDSLLRRSSRWEIISPAQQGIINFRWVPGQFPSSQWDLLNQQLSQTVNKTGYVQILTTELDGKKVLRMCILNPETDESDLTNTVRLLNETAEQLSRQTILDRCASS